ncbi:hypothetical protein KVT40_005040 [Elsinoe batatas]|uniref:K Homology domain-containing protein n=1 Tax=Elsinoe batatas TaxID=2601811 RepID=A0A8K0PGH7_9PEZI|nr:hypothetical protein KVT40_005040 [Elsinoe batatas]
MHKIGQITGQARHGWDAMRPSMGFSRPHQHDLSGPPPGKRNHGAVNALPPNPAMPGHLINLSFNVPFASNLAGLEPEEVIYASPGAFNRWTHPQGTPEGTPIHELPVHRRDVENLRTLCKTMSEGSGGAVQATVTSSKPKPVPGMQRGPLTALVTNVCISGDAEIVHKMRSKILNDTPITLRSSSVEVSPSLLMNPDQTECRADVLKHMDEIADKTKADIFLLHPKQTDESASVHGNLELSTEGKLRVVIYGDMECCDHAKTRLLIMIDQILGRVVDTIKLELTLHNLICGRHRRNIKLIESATNTAIYFPPLFPTVFGYSPAGAFPRSRDEIIITGDNQDNILQAKKRLYDLVQATKTFVKDVAITTSKVDYILLERLEKIKKIIEQNGSYVLLPPLGNHSGVLRVQATDILNVERTVREIMSLAGQFYSASWWLTGLEASQRQPTPADIRAMLPDICINSGAEITFEKLNFHINGSDDAVKAAMTIINSLPFVKKASSTLRVKVELANEHKEFVSGKKNGKINKIMSQSNVQIVFDGFNEYNFYIDVRGSSYEATKNGLDLVELEMPASISFHVPDQYHKRIIGIGGQHIQRIMKKYSVFVKFSNAMDRGVHGKDEDDVKIDNVICRTPARNADNLELVKNEIMEMVEKVDAEFVSENVPVDRLYHRELIARMGEIEELEKKWNCKITFPGTEQASDIIVVSGPEYQVPQAVDEFLGMVPESHDIAFPSSPELREYLTSDDFRTDTLQKLREQYVVEVLVRQPRAEPIEGQPSQTRVVENLLLTYTRNNAGGLKDAIDFLIIKLVGHGLDSSTLRGAIPRPKSDSFEDSMPYFDSKLLQRAEPPLSTESPTRAQFEDTEPRSIFDKLRKPGSISSFSSFLDRRKNGGTSTPGSLFKHASSNASKASLVSMESRESGYRNPWNDSGIDLEHDQLHPHNSWGSFTAAGSRPATSSASLTTYESKFPFGAGNASSTSLNTPIIPGLGGDVTPKYDAAADGHPKSATPHASATSLTSLKDTPRPTSSSNTTTAPANSGYPAPIGPPR